LGINGQISRIAIDKTRAKTPPTLLGIERKIAYAIRKYHSGWIWTGVTRGFAGIKFSGSPSNQGLVKHSIRRKKNITKNPNRSLYVK